MQPSAQASQQPAPPPITTPNDAGAFVQDLMTTMTALLAIIERETELVRGGDVRAAMSLEADKTELSRRYLALIGRLKPNHTYMRKAVPDLLAGLQRHHDTFRAMLQINLTVLATAHAVSEGIIRGVNTEMQRKRAPQTYTASGQSAAPPPRSAAPLSISRTM